MAKLRAVEESETLDGEQPVLKTDGRKRPRIMIPIEDGRPVLEKLTEEQRAALRESLSETAAPGPEPVSPVVIQMAVQAIAGIEAAIVAPRFGLDGETARQCVMPPAPLAEQISIAGARVADKYAGALGRWQDEIVLATLLVAWQSAVFAALRRAAAERQMREEAERQAAQTAPAPAEPAEAA